MVHVAVGQGGDPDREGVVKASRPPRHPFDSLGLIQFPNRRVADRKPERTLGPAAGDSGNGVFLLQGLLDDDGLPFDQPGKLVDPPVPRSPGFQPIGNHQWQRVLQRLIPPGVGQEAPERDDRLPTAGSMGGGVKAHRDRDGARLRRRPRPEGHQSNGSERPPAHQNRRWSRRTNRSERLTATALTT